MVFIIIIIIILPRQRLACHQCTLFVISDFSVTMLKVETKIKMIFFFFKIGDWLRSEINLGTKLRIGPKCRDQKYIYFYFLFCVHQFLLILVLGRCLSFFLYFFF